MIGRSPVMAAPTAALLPKEIQVLNDYWFDWQGYNPKTAVYNLGAH